MDEIKDFPAGSAYAISFTYHFQRHDPELHVNIYPILDYICALFVLYIFL